MPRRRRPWLDIRFFAEFCEMAGIKFSISKELRCLNVFACASESTAHNQQASTYGRAEVSATAQVQLLSRTVVPRDHSIFLLPPWTMDSSALRSLPAELRAAIFEEVLTHPLGICIEIDQGSLKLNSPAPSSCPLALLATCHQIRSESLELFWRNHFRFTVWAFNDVLEPRESRQVEALGDRWPNITHAWMERIGPQNRHCIRSIDFDLGFWNTARRELGHFSREYIGPELARLHQRWCSSASPLRITAYILVSYNVNAHCLWGLRLGLAGSELSQANEAIRAGEFDRQRSIVFKDEPLNEAVCAYGFHGKKVFPSTRTALLALVGSIQNA